MVQIVSDTRSVIVNAHKLESGLLKILGIEGAILVLFKDTEEVKRTLMTKHFN